MEKQKIKVKILFDYINYVTLPSNDPQIKLSESRKVSSAVKQISTLLPSISYSMFSEIVTHLDQNGSTFECYLSRQISTLYFLLRLAPIASGSYENRLNILDPNTKELFPEGLLSEDPYKLVGHLLGNYLTESWNWYVEHGPSLTEREVMCNGRLYSLIAEIVRIYGSGTWPFFYHFESSDHVDNMLKLIEENNGRIPVPTREN